MTEERRKQIHDAGFFNKIAIKAIEWADNNPQKIKGNPEMEK